MAIQKLVGNAKPWAPVQVIEADLAAVGDFTQPMTVRSGERVSVSIMCSSDFVGTVVLQRMLNAQDWRDVPSADSSVGFINSTEQTYDADESCFLRIGLPSAASAGSVHARLGKG